MPRIPVATQQVETGALPNARVANVVTPEAFGVNALGRVAQAQGRAGAQIESNMGRLGSIISRRAEELKNEEDHVEVMKMTQAFQSEVNKHLYEKNTGVMFKQGFDAKGISEATPAYLEKLSKEYTAKLKNPKQQTMFGQYAGTTINSTASEVMRHESVQHRVATIKETDATANLLVQSALMSNDPQKIATTFMQIQDLVTKTHGKDSPQTVAAEMMKYTSHYHGLKVQQIAYDRPAEALDYLDRNREKMDQNLYQTLRQQVGARVQKVDIEREAEKLAAAFGMDFKSADAHIDSLPGPTAGKVPKVDNPDQYFTGKPMTGVKADLVNTAAAAAAKLGIKIVVNSAFRTPEDQKRLADAWAAGDRSGYKPAAPGTSPHETGDAFDTNSFDHLSDAEVAALGLRREPGDPIHYTLGTPTGGGGYSDEHKMQLKERVRIKMQHNYTQQNMAEHQALEGLKEKLAGKDFNTQIELLESATGVSKWAREQMKQHLITNKPSDPATYWTAKTMAENGVLTVEALQAVASKLSGSHFNQLFGEIIKTQAQMSRTEKEKEALAHDKYVSDVINAELANGWTDDQRGAIKHRIEDLTRGITDLATKKKMAEDIVRSEKSMRGSTWANVTTERQTVVDLSEKFGADLVQGVFKNTMLRDRAGRFDVDKAKEFVELLDADMKKDPEVKAAVAELIKDRQVVSPNNVALLLARKAWSDKKTNDGKFDKMKYGFGKYVIGFTARDNPFSPNWENNTDIVW